MNKYKSYNVPNISFEKIKELENNFLKQVHNDNIKKVEIEIDNEYININIEPYYKESNLWDTLIEAIKTNKTKFWFRDDDAGMDNNSLKNLMDYLSNKNINLLIAAIPKLSNANLKVLLDNYDNYIVAQHGYAHVSHTDSDSSEYPDLRDINDIKAELIEGNQILEKLFEDKYIKVFIPPWFEVGNNTKKLLKENNYIALSNYWNNKINLDGLIEINTQVDFVNWDDAYTFGGEEFVIEQILNEINSGNNFIGLLLHHERVAKETYVFLDKLLDAINKYGIITSFNEVLEGYQND